MVAILQDNQLIFKAIDLLTAAANASAQMSVQEQQRNNTISQFYTSNETNNQGANHIVLTNNTHILNNSYNSTSNDTNYNFQSSHSLVYSTKSNGSDNNSPPEQQQQGSSMAVKLSIPNNSQNLPILVPSSIISLPTANEVFLFSSDNNSSITNVRTTTLIAKDTWSEKNPNVIYLPSSQNGPIILLNSLKLPGTVNNQTIQVSF